MRTIPNYRFIIIGLICSIMFVIISLCIQSERNEKRNEQYDDIERETAFSGTISELEIVKGYSYLTIGDSNYVIYPSLNRKYDEEYLSEKIVVGDSLLKHSGSDTIYVFHDNHKYEYIHNSVIEK